MLRVCEVKNGRIHGVEVQYEEGSLDWNLVHVSIEVTGPPSSVYNPNLQEVENVYRPR